MTDYLFGSLCAAYEEAYKEVESYLEVYGQFMGNLITGLEVHLNCPRQRIEYYSREDKRISLREAMYLDKGAWRLNIGIRMWRENGPQVIAASPSGLYYPPQTVKLSILLKGTPAASIVKLAQFNEEFSIKKETEENDKKSFYDFIVQKVQSHYKNMLRYILEHDSVPEVLGDI